MERPDFHAQHIFFEEQYHQLEEIIDEVVERVRTLGHYAEATMKAYLELMHLTEQTRDKNNSAGFIKDLLKGHETIIIHVREHIDRFADDLNDQDTSDFITGLIRNHEKMSWMLRTHLR